MKKVLFVCLGNICRSPTAEGIFRKMVERENLSHKITIDSAGTLGHHSGESPDPRMIHHAANRGYDLTSVARGISAQDFGEFDYILTMDDENFRNVTDLCQSQSNSKIIPMMQFSEKFDHKQVPDPYYGGPDGFELVIDLLEDACSNFLTHLKKELN